MLTAPFQYVTRIDTGPLKAQLSANPQLWAEQTGRLGAGSPHAASVDIWARYRDLAEYRLRYGDNMAHFCDEHESVWLPPALSLPAVVPISETIGAGRKLGGVLLTKLAPGNRIERHADGGWHAAAHDKYYVAVQNAPGASFHWDNCAIYPRDGDVYQFRNDIPHWCINNSAVDRISMIICVRRADLMENAA